MPAPVAALTAAIDAEKLACATDDDCAAVESQLSPRGSAFFGVAKTSLTPDRQTQLGLIEAAAQGACALVPVACTDPYRAAHADLQSGPEKMRPEGLRAHGLE